MKTSTIQYIITFIGLILSVTSFFVIDNYFTFNKKSTTYIVEKAEVANQTIPVIDEDLVEKMPAEENITEKVVEEKITEEKIESTTKKIIPKEEPIISIGEEIIYDGLTLTELTNKLNKNLNSTIEGKGIYFAEYTKKTGLDPYLSLAIVLQETGCKWNCSKLVRDCNNVGGIKGKPSCNGGSYKSFETLEDGINGYLEMIYNNYYSKGLTTPELMNPKYAASTEWSRVVNNYMETIRAS